MKNHQDQKEFIQIDEYLKLQQEFAEKEQKVEERLWLDASVSQFDNVLRLNFDKSTVDFSKIVLDYAAELTKAYVGVFYIHNQDTNIIQATAGYACVIDKLNQQTYVIGEGIVGQAIESKKIIYFNDLLAKNIEIKSSTLNIGAAGILIIPLVFNDKAFGVMELVFLRNLEPKFQQLLEVVSRNVAAMLESITNNELTKLLLEQSQSQAESLQSQEEELRQNMEELQTTQEQMRQKNMEIENRISAVNNSGIASIELDLDANILDANDAFLQIYGYSREELIGKKHKMLVSQSYAESSDYQELLNNLRNGIPQSGEFQRFGKDDKEIYVMGAYSIIKNAEGNPYRIFKLVTDITSTKQLLQQSQEQAESLRAQEEELRQNMEELQATQEQMIKKQEEVDEARAKNESMEKEEAERAAKVAEMQKKTMLLTTQKLKAKLDELQKVKEEMEKMKEEESKRAIRVTEMQKQTVSKIILRLRDTEAKLNELKKSKTTSKK